MWCSPMLGFKLFHVGEGSPSLLYGETTYGCLLCVFWNNTRKSGIAIFTTISVVFAASENNIFNNVLYSKIPSCIKTFKIWLDVLSVVYQCCSLYEVICIIKQISYTRLCFFFGFNFVVTFHGVWCIHPCPGLTAAKHFKAWTNRYRLRNDETFV